MSLAPLPKFYGLCPACGARITSKNGSQPNGRIVHIGCPAGVVARAVGDAIAKAVDLNRKLGLPPLGPRKPSLNGGIEEMLRPEAFKLDEVVPDIETDDEVSDATATAKRGGKSKGNNNLCTPAAFIAVVKRFAPIALDPFGGARVDTVQARRKYLIENGEDAFVLPWAEDGHNFANPPYNRTKDAIARADNQWTPGKNEHTLLIASRTGARGVQSSLAPLVCFIQGRLKFIDPATGRPPLDSKGKESGAMFDSLVLGYTLDEERFRRVFSTLGKVVRWND